MAKNKSAHVKAGIVVVAGLAILAVGMFLVSGGSQQFEAKAYYTILFKNSGGIAGGDTVYLDGQRVGYVHETARTKRQTDDAKVLRYIAVTIEVNEKIEIPIDSEFVVTQTVTKIVSMEVTSGDSPDLAPRGVGAEDTELRGERLKTFEQTIHEAGELMGDAREVVQNVNEVVKKVDRKVGEVDIKTIQGKINTFLDSINRSGTNVEEILDESRDPIRATLANARDATGELKGLATDLHQKDWPALRPKVHTILDNSADATGEVKGIVRENRAKIKSFFEKLDDGAARIGPALETIEVVGRTLNDTVVEVRPQLLGAMRSARKAMENFDALTHDLKAAPWKLVNEPGNSEERLMFEAAQTYVASAAEVGKTIEDLDTLNRLGVLNDPEQVELVEKLMERMRKSLAEFETNEKKLVGLLVDKNAPADK